MVGHRHAHAVAVFEFGREPDLCLTCFRRTPCQLSECSRNSLRGGTCRIASIDRGRGAKSRGAVGCARKLSRRRKPTSGTKLPSTTRCSAWNPYRSPRVSELALVARVLRLQTRVSVLAK